MSPEDRTKRFRGMADHFRSCGYHVGVCPIPDNHICGLNISGESGKRPYWQLDVTEDGVSLAWVDGSFGRYYATLFSNLTWSDARNIVKSSVIIPQEPEEENDEEAAWAGQPKS